MIKKTSIASILIICMLVAATGVCYAVQEYNPGKVEVLPITLKGNLVYDSDAPFKIVLVTDNAKYALVPENYDYIDKLTQSFLGQILHSILEQIPEGICIGSATVSGKPLYSPHKQNLFEVNHVRSIKIDVIPMVKEPVRNPGDYHRIKNRTKNKDDVHCWI